MEKCLIDHEISNWNTSLRKKTEQETILNDLQRALEKMILEQTKTMIKLTHTLANCIICVQ